MTNNEEQHLLKELIRHQMKEYTDRMKKVDSGRDNNSFIFLENNTLDMLITYLFIQMDHQQNSENSDSGANSADLEVILKSLDSMIDESRRAYNDIIDILKAKT
ncbi:hypothetical protein [Sediminibacillus massiliensis]|uniref:hypothetical protein n=1 Tax=Sediminibacillus massiliensis TaxID=1926277 RepID=UPI0009883031|nr:hypothetical protein [Sediminibacillus massiliensis]